MDRRIGTLAVVLAAVAANAGCGPQLQSPDPSPKRASESSRSVASAPQVTPDPFVEPQPDLRRRGIEFVRSALIYDASAHARSAFISRVRTLVTSDELGRLRQSERAQLNWPVLRERHERVTLKITGASADTSSLWPVLVVEGVRTTTTAFATVHDLIEVTVVFDAAGDDALIRSATGGGL